MTPVLAMMVYWAWLARLISTDLPGPLTPTPSCPLSTLREVTETPVATSAGRMFVDVLVVRLNAKRRAGLEPFPPPRVLPVPKYTVSAVAATACAMVAPGSGTPQLVMASVAGSYSHKDGALVVSPPPARYTLPSGATASARMSRSPVSPTPTAGTLGVLRSQR